MMKFRYRKTWDIAAGNQISVDFMYIERLSKNPQNCDFGNFRINDINKLQASKTRIQGFSTPMKKLPSSKKEF
jgi:hypothetical protein